MQLRIEVTEQTLGVSYTNGGGFRNTGWGWTVWKDPDEGPGNDSEYVCGNPAGPLQSKSAAQAEAEGWVRVNGRQALR